MLDRFPCPKCGRSLERSGEVVIDGERRPVFQCDECLKVVRMFGEPFEVALTFVVDENGRAFDPADPDPDLAANS